MEGIGAGQTHEKGISMTDKPSIESLKRMGVCHDAMLFARKHTSLYAAWRACRRPDWMLWLLGRINYRDARAYRRFACWCVRHTPLPNGRTVWGLLTDERSRNAVIVAERYARGKATAKDLDAAWDAAGAAAGAAARDAQANQLRAMFPWAKVKAKIAEWEATHV